VPTHLTAEEIALYAEREPGAADGAELSFHLQSCDVCLMEVVEARNAADFAKADAGLPPRRALSPRLARYVRGEESKKKEGSDPPIGLIASVIGGIAGAIASSHFSGEMSFADVRKDSADASQHSERHGMNETDAHHVTRPDPIIGTPAVDGNHFPGQQSYADTCAIRCQEFVLRQYTGTELPEKFFVDEARAHGWYHEGHGTSPADVGKLLELHGVPVHRYVDASPWHLAAELGQGHKVIIGVDSDSLWQQHPIQTELRHLLGFGAADHAIVVSGIDTSDPDHTKVIVSDPGTGEAAARYPMEQFLDAWKDSHFYMVATQEPPPPELHLPEMSHFDYHAGHIDHVGELSWDHFQDAYESHDDATLVRALDPHHDDHQPDPDLSVGHDAAFDHQADADHDTPFTIDPHDHHDVDDSFDTDHDGYGAEEHHDDVAGGGHHDE